ncbi:porin [Burkholderia contaminans]|uniref:porin n=1 Tax=Burkholderia contaminans TaxID=488447 RepID=UPI00310CE22F
MNKSLIALAVTSAVAVPVFAQSSVTLYGVIDVGIDYVNNSTDSSGHHGPQWSAVSGVTQGSRWGLKGSEDLGGGTKAIFQLENGFNPFTGTLNQHGREFGRQAYVGLTNASFGTLTLGRQYDPIVDLVQPTTMNGNWGALFSHPSDIDNTDNGFRINNAVKYVSPSYAGLQAEALYAFGGVAGSFGTNSTISAGLSYKAGPLYLGAAYFYARNPAEQFNDANFQSNGSTTHGIFNYVGLPSNMQTFGLGGTYAIGPALIGVSYSNVRFDNANGVVGSSTKFDNAELWGQYSLTQAATLALGYTYTWGKQDATGARPKYNQLNAMADYRLSSRTDVYVQGIFQHATGGANADIYDGFAGGQSTTNNQVLARVGMRHKF